MTSQSLQLALTLLSTLKHGFWQSTAHMRVNGHSSPERQHLHHHAGVQIHSWGKLYDDESPNLEFVQPCMVYTVVNGEKTGLDLGKIPALTPRQIKELASAQEARVPTLLLGHTAALYKLARTSSVLILAALRSAD